MQATHPASDAPFQQLCGSSHSAACIDGEMSLTQGEGCRETSAGTGTATSTIELAQRSRTSSQSSPVYRENGTVFIEEARESWAAATRSGLEPPAAVPVSRPMHVNLGGTVQLLCPPILQEYLSHVIGGALGAAWAVPAAANQQGTLSPEAAAELQESAARGMQVRGSLMPTKHMMHITLLLLVLCPSTCLAGTLQLPVTDPLQLPCPQPTPA
jgi:hypothetical protein